MRVIGTTALTLFLCFVALCSDNERSPQPSKMFDFAAENADVLSELSPTSPIQTGEWDVDGRVIDDNWLSSDGLEQCVDNMCSDSSVAFAERNPETGSVNLGCFSNNVELGLLWETNTANGKVTQMVQTTEGISVQSGSDQMQQWFLCQNTLLDAATGCKLKSENKKVAPNSEYYLANGNLISVRPFDNNLFVALWNGEEHSIRRIKLDGITEGRGDVELSGRFAQPIVNQMDENCIAVGDSKSGFTSMTIRTEHKASITHVVFSPDSTRFLSVSRDETVRLFDANSGELIGHSPTGCKLVSAICWLTDDEFVTVSLDGSICIWDGRVPTRLRCIEDTRTKLITAVLCTSKNSFFTGDYLGTVKKWTVRGQLFDARVMEECSDAPNCGPISREHVFDGANDRELCDRTLGDSDCAIVKFSKEHSSESTSWNPLMSANTAGIGQKSKSVHWNPQIDTVTETPPQTQWPKKYNGRIELQWEAPTECGEVSRLLQSADDIAVLSKSEQSSMCESTTFLEANTGNAVGGNCHDACGELSAINVQSSDNGQFLFATKPWDKVLRVSQHKGDGEFSIENIALNGMTEGIGHVDGNGRFALPVFDRRAERYIRVVDAHSGFDVMSIRTEHRDFISQVFFSPDSTRLLSVSRDETVRLFDASNGRMLAVVQISDPTNVCWLTDDVFVSVSMDGSISIWDSHAPKLLRRIANAHTTLITAVLCTSEYSFVTGDCLGTVKKWTLG